MILRDRNHPSVVIWSIGNEIQERADSSGVAIAVNMIKAIHAIDTTRPVTEAICDFWDNPDKKWDYTANAFKVLDIGGYNYQWQKYESDHQKFPGRIMMGTESVPKEASRNWHMVEKHPYVIGDFVWTGWDYLGETGIGHATWVSDKNFRDPFAMPWPWYVSNCGDIDIVGDKKPQSFYRDVVWGVSPLEVAIHEPAPAGKHEVVFFWGWPKEEQSWNWKGHEGEAMKVSVYSTCPVVRLELNGKNIGEKTVPADSDYTVIFTVPYHPGELKVTGIEDGKVKATKILRTSGPAASLLLSPERKQIKAGRDEIVYIPVIAQDSEGNPVPDSRLPVSVKVGGAGELLAAGNASPLAEGSLRDGNFTLFRGKGMIIVRSSGNEGEIIVDAQPEGLKSVRTVIKTVAGM
jgi:beta-galactosidase